MLTIVVYVLGIFAFFLTLIRSNDFIYLPSGLFYQYTIYFIPFFIIFIIIILQRRPYLEYNIDGNKTWLYKQPLKFRKLLRLLTNTIQVSLITILIYYSLGIVASYFPQNYTYYAYNTKITWKDTSYSRKRGTHYLIGTEMTDNLMPDNHQLIYTIVSGVNRNYFFTKRKTYNDLYVNKKIIILSKTSLLWGEYLYDIDYDKSNVHYKNSTNILVDKPTSKSNCTTNNNNTIHQHHNDLNKTNHQRVLPTIYKKTPSKPTYPALIKYKKQ